MSIPSSRLTGRQFLAQRGAAQPQGPANYGGFGGRVSSGVQRPVSLPPGGPQNYGGVGGQVPSGMRIPGSSPSRGIPGTTAAPPPSGAQSRQMRQVNDVSFNRGGTPPVAKVRQAAPEFVGVGPQPGGYKPPTGTYAGGRALPGYGGAPASPGFGVFGGATPGQMASPRLGGSYSGFMGAQQMAPDLRQVLAPPQPSGALANQSAMGPKSRTGIGWLDSAADSAADTYRAWDQQQRDNSEGDANESATGTGTRTETQEQRDQGMQQQSQANQQNSDSALIPAMGTWNPLGNSSGGSGNPVMNKIVSDIGQLLGGMTNEMNKQDKQRLEDYYGESLGGYREIMDAARGMFDPAARQQWEDAARQDLFTSVNADKLANERALQAAAGRGGAMSSNAGTSILNNAAMAMAKGENELAQGRFSRDMAATQAGISGIGAGSSALADLLGEGFTSNKELLAYLLTGAEKGADAGQLLADIVGGKWV